MMKKVFLSLLMAIVCLPALFAQTNVGHVIKIDSVAACGDYTWVRDGQVYTTDTVSVFSTTDTTFILNLVKLTSYFDTLVPIEVSGSCSASWNDYTWDASGVYYDTLISVMGCDSVLKINVTIDADNSVINEVVCGSYTASWGVVYTQSIELDTLIIDGDCEMNKKLSLTVNPVYTGITQEVQAGCYYNWGDLVITDTDPHTLTFTTEAGCDSTVTLTVTAFTAEQRDTTAIAACDFYKFDWADTILESGVYTHHFTDAEMDDCDTYHVYELTIVKSNNDTAATQPVTVQGGCFYVWNGDTITDDQVHYHLYTSTVGQCDSLAAISITYDGIHRDTSFVQYCGNRYRWSDHNKALPNPGATYDYTSDTTVSVDVANADGSCTTRYTLVLTMVNEYDTINKYFCGDEWVYGVGSGNDRFKVENPTTHALVDGRDTLRASGLYSETADGRPYIYVKSQSTQCRTYRTINLTLRTPEQRYRKSDDVVKACDEYRYKADYKRGDWVNFKGVLGDSVHFDTVIVHKEHSTIRTGSCYDSIGHLILTIYSRTVTNQNVSECDSYEWMSGDSLLGVYTTSGDYQDTLLARTEYGCLQIANLKLTINRTPTIDIVGNWILEPQQSTVLHAVPSSDSDPITRYKWYVNGTEQGGNVDSLTLGPVMENTDVRLESTTNHNCTATNWITVTANVGIDEAESMHVSLYPNPASRFLNVEGEQVIRTVAIYNALGQQAMNIEVNSHKTTLDLGTLTAGTYMMRIVGEDGSVSMSKFIVSK